MTALDAEFDPRAAAPRKRPAPRHESETSRTQKVLTWLNAQPETFARKVHTGPMGEGGHPDIDGCQRGRAFKIEMKKPGERPTLRQMARLRRWQQAGALVGWAESIEHAAQILAHVDDLTWRNPLSGPGASA
ncbi:MAG TPA: hypothetical protein VD864_01085 [Nocardioides sp.]|nr:hypothetical protein [Nocardioides sp.]